MEISDATNFSAFLPQWHLMAGTALAFIVRVDGTNHFTDSGEPYRIAIRPLTKLAVLSSIVKEGRQSTVALSLESAGEVTREVFDTFQRRVALAASGSHDAGGHLLPWNGRNTDGERVGAGLEITRLKYPGERKVIPLVVK